MCGRYTVFTEEEVIEMREILHEINMQFAAQAAQMKTGEIFPTNLAPVLVSDRGRAAARLMNWGFPRWDGGGVVINARAETAAQKSMFRASLAARRCVVPSTGFYEWQRLEGKKQKDKYLINLPGTPMLYMAGVYNLFDNPSGEKEARFVILTAAANQSVAPLHDRMPVILLPEEKENWLSGGDIAGHILSREGPELVLKKTA